MTGYQSKRAAAQDKLDSMEREALKLALKVLEDLPGFRADIDNAITAIKEALAQQKQEPMAFAGIEMWVGGARIANYLTQTELQFARDPWMLMQYSADLCLAKLKENNNG